MGGADLGLQSNFREAQAMRKAVGRVVVLAVVSVGLGVWALRTVRAGSSRFLAAKG